MTNQLVSLRSEWLRLLTQDALNTGLDFVFPPRCVGCGCVGSLFCSDCHTETPIPEAPPLPAGPLEGLWSSALYEGPIRSAIHTLKFRGMRRMADALSERLVKTLSRANWHFNLILPVPLHPSRLQERGYNQSALLARAVARHMGRLRAYQPDALIKARVTSSQVGLNWRERQANVRDAFEAAPDLVSGQAVVLLDDVYTTGATLHECASALRAAGAAHVWGLTVARVGTPPGKEPNIEQLQQP
ncbi:MAG: ComF family protein [Anaerolinea sp.]|nr:ComF family protein [Anaerolinea sp.]